MSMTTQRPPVVPDHGASVSRGRRRWWIAVLLLTVVAVIGVVVAAPFDDDDTTAPATGPTVAPTTEPVTATTTTVVDRSTAVWPTAASGLTYDDPREAARGFATGLVGFRDPVVGEFRQGDTRSGEVDVRAMANGPVTTVLVRQLSGEETWSVLGAATANIELQQPAALAVVTSPLELRGRSTAFEATVAVAVRADDDTEPLYRGFVMGGANGTFAPFDASVTFRPPTAEAGTVVLWTESAMDGRVWEASVIRVRFR